METSILDNLKEANFMDKEFMNIKMAIVMKDNIIMKINKEKGKFISKMEMYLQEIFIEILIILISV